MGKVKRRKTNACRIVLVLLLELVLDPYA